MTETFRCSDAARERADPMGGTAPPQPRLLLVEVPGGWPFDALQALPADVRDDVLRESAAARARVLLIRRPGEHPRREGPWRWYAVDPGAPAGSRTVRGSWQTGEELLAGARRVRQMAQEVARPGGDAPEDGPEDEQLLLVCTHGRKDVCCALRGRPVAAELGRTWPEQTWECSHTGGDRFAANLLVLPDGACYGGLDAGTVAQVVRDHRGGAPAVGHLRGRVGQDRMVQSAVLAALGRWPVPWDAVQPLGAPVPLPPEAVDEPRPGSEPVVARWRTDLSVRGHGAWRATGVERLAPAQRLTCRAPQAGSVRIPEVVGWAELPAARDR
ncbi:Sucraseferredoxin family protein [Serinicoccus hydrothermalis]|uniref:Sucraseferredoxin family protein n=1 Tax=Serinicoccus hydrothermalis TaxID=1758689 RepID=A0A1B1NAM7_9MICO|nr:sucrase ferredoxin [Serinicoccus hydrothermalis]ANS78490.1 Sucraseferredoxin family protein [Serinicoccus hydrothermalis]